MPTLRFARARCPCYAVCVEPHALRVELYALCGELHALRVELYALRVELYRVLGFAGVVALGVA
ncbi:MAG: hypothetical protein RMJ83_03135 [Armatimonadota bacterium]|nr:hypothetical protein [Armatimonadota bacterium]